MKTKLLILLLILSSITLFSQKSASVVGDAAQLVDLLKKDYSISNPDTRDDEIASDRSKVTAIFKSYVLQDSLKNYFATASQKNDTNGKKSIDTTYAINLKNYLQLKEALSDVSKLMIEKNNNYSLLFDEYKEIKEEYILAKDNYYKSKKSVDSLAFTNLILKFDKQNPYLKEVLVKFKEKYELLAQSKTDYFATQNSYSSIQKSIPFLGGDMAFETIIDGLSRFLAKRIKEELTIHAIDKIKNYLDNPTPENYCHELLTVLPTTTNYLKSFDSDQLLKFTDEFKQYIEEDLNNLLENAVHLKDTPRIKSYIANNPDLEFAFEGLETIPLLSKIKSPVDYFELLENSRTLTNWRSDSTKVVKYNIAQSFRLAAMLAYSMTIVENSEVKFASVDFISNYANEKNFYFLYFGFLHQQNEKYFKINFYNPANNAPITFDISTLMTTFTPETISDTSESFIFLKSNLTAIAKNAEKIYAQALSIKKKNKNNEEVKYDEIYSFINDFIDFSEEIVTTADLLVKDKFKITNPSVSIDLKSKISPYFNVAKIANTMVLDLHQKKYSNAIIKAIEIPLHFSDSNSDLSLNLQNISDKISFSSDLVVLQTLYKEKTFTNLSKSDKIEKLQSINASLEVLALKTISTPELSAFKTAIDNFSIYVNTLNTAPDEIKNLNEKIEELKNATRVVITNDKLLKYAGVSKVEILKSVKEQLEKKKYDAAVVNSIISKIDTYLNNQFKKHILNDTTLASEEITITAIISEFAPQLLKNNTKINDKTAIKIIHFINDVSVSKDAEDIEKALDAFALPVGSSSLKEKASNYVSINSYPGLLGGFEFSKNQKTAGNIGFTAPVGIYCTIASFEKGATLGVFLPVIDIAAPVRLRLDSNNDTKTLPDFNFNDIFSPGVYLSYGFGKSPFAIQLGAQYGPKLRDIPEESTGSFTSVDSYRINIGFVIDIPLLTLYSQYKN